MGTGAYMLGVEPAPNAGACRWRLASSAGAVGAEAKPGGDCVRVMGFQERRRSVCRLLPAPDQGILYLA